MIIFNVAEGDGSLIVHMTGDNSNYTVSYDHGKLIFTNTSRQYIIPETNADDIYFGRADPNTSTSKYNFIDYRNLYRDTLPTDFGIGNITNAEPNGIFYTEEITLGGVNDKVAVIAPAGVVIIVNGNAVSSGTLVDNGDIIKFEVTAPAVPNTPTIYNISVGDITKSFSITSNYLKSCKDILDAGLSAGDGVYTINPTTTESFSIYCDMTVDGGGWTLVRKMHGSVIVGQGTTDYNRTHMTNLTVENARVSDTIWNQLNPTQVWNICNGRQSILNRNMSVAWYSNHGVDNSCSYSRNFWTSVQRDFGAPLLTNFTYNGACGGANVAGAWTTLSGIYAGSAHYGCYDNSENATTTSPVASSKYAADSGSNGWSGHGFVFVR